MNECNELERSEQPERSDLERSEPERSKPTSIWVKKMGRPKKEVPMNDNLAFKLSSEDKFYYMRLAKSNGQSISNFIRSALFELHGNSNDLNL